MNKKIRFSLLTLLVMLCGTVFADYQKVTATADITDGEYLIVYEAENVAFNGALETLDAARNNVAVTINEGKISSTDAIDAAVFTINTTDNSIKSASGFYVGAGQSYSNGLKQSATLTDQFKHTSFAIDDNGNVIITKNIAEGQNMILNYNSNSSDKRFRYYKEGSQKKIQLYKKIAAAPAGYTIDFNKSIIVPSSNKVAPVFQVSIGWTRIAPSAAGDGYGPYYMLYNYKSTEGVGETGALLANAQCAPQSTYDGTIETVNDYLVTPKVSGTVTLQVKGSSSANATYPSFVKFYAINDDATTVGDEITPTFSGDINNDDYVTATLTLTEATRIAIRAQWVYMDNFTATSAEVPEVKSLTVASVMNMEGKEGTQGTTTYFEQQADGTLSVPLKVLLSNTGNVDFVAGTTENYTLALATASYASGSKTYYDDIKAIPVSLAAGASDTIEVTFSIPYTTGWKYYFVKENVTGTTSSSSRYAGVTAYEPKFVFRAAESTSTSSLSAAQAFGLISEETTKNFEIANTGTAPLIIKSITLPTGFTSANMPEIPAEGLSIAKGATQALDITLPATTLGSYSGNLTIVYLDKNSAEQTYTLAFSGNVLPAGTWAADFSGESGIGYPAGSIAEGGITSGYQYADGTYNYHIMGRTSSSYATGSNMFITPKLHATANQTLTFDVKGVSGASYYAKVYVSTDRKTWGDPVAYFTYGEKDGAVAIGSSDWVNKSITFETEGDYYVAFSLYGEFKIDNIIGLTKVDVAHDLYIKSINWPDASIKSGASQTKPSLDVIPLTDEAADAYTVKYVCGETVLAEGTPVALTASANSSKTFSFSWTPTVESTTAYPGTKVVFEFTNGTKIESESFDLTVTNEPIFHFISSLPSSKWYEPTDVSAPIVFAKTNQADKKNFYVYNWGSAPLTVKSIAVPAGFTATPAEQFSVPAFDENNLSAAAQAVEITFSAAEAGTYSGNMVITYVNGLGNDSTFTLAISGTKLDPTKWYANFDDGGWPAGSVYQSNVSSTNGGTYSAPNYYITSSSTTNNIFVTPKLTAAAGEKLMFDAKLYSSYWSEGKVVVYAAATREEVLNAEEGTTRDTLFSVSGQDAENAMTTDFQTFEVTVPTAGDYFFGFEISNRPYVDEIYGLKPAAVAHDWTIASSNVPTEAMQNVAATATVNILNLGLADEAADSYTATLFVNGEAVATADAVAIPMSHKLSDAGTQLSFNFRYPKVGTFPVYIEVKTGDYSVKTAPVDVVFAEEAAIAEAIEIGSGSTTTYSYAPIDFYNFEQARTSDILYTSAQLTAFGLKSGDKITSLAFKGTLTSAKTLANSSLKAWVAMSTGDITYGSPDKSAMTEIAIYNAGDMVFVSGTNMVTINLPEAITYDGTSDLRIYLEGGGNSEFVSLNFAYDSNYQNMKWSNATSMKYNPLLYVTLAAEPVTISGTVKNAEGAAVEGATVTLISNDGENVQYTGKTDAEGAYSINVIQASRTYNIEVEAEGYEPASAVGVSFAEGNVAKDFVVDVPLLKKYFVNTDLASTEGWTAVTSDGFKDLGTGKIGEYKVKNEFSAATVDEYHPATAYAFGFECRWSTNYSSYTQESKVDLPAGTYTLTFDVENVNGGTTKATYENRFTVTVGDKVFTDQSTEWMNGKSAWTNHSIVFDVTEDAKATLSLGFGTGSNNFAQANTPVLYVSNLYMTCVSLLDGALMELNSEIAEAEALKTNTRTEGIRDFNAAITTAEALLTSTDVAAIKAGIETLKAAELTFLTVNLPVAEGTYYVYNPLTQKFLSRGNAYGTSAMVDDYGVAVNVTVTDLTTASYKLSSFDNGAAYGFDAWMYADAGGNNVRTYNINKVERGVTLTNTNNNQLVYVYLKDDANKFQVAGNAIKDDNYDNDAQTVWQFITKEDHDAMIAAREAAQKTAAFTSAGIAEDAQVEVAEPTLVSFTSGNAWTQTVVRSENNQPATNDNGTEMWQATGNYTQTIKNVPTGLYKISIQAFYRNGGADECVARYNTGYNTVLAYLEANGNKVQVKSWATDKGEGNDPNSMTQAKAKFDAGKYLAETYAYVGADSILNLTVNNPAHIGNGWFIVGNVKYAKVEKGTPAGDANLDGDVTTSDAVAAVNFALEKETPSEKAFKAADVNNSNSITVSDAVGIVNIALGKPAGDEAATARGEKAETVNYLTMNGASLNLTNSTEFVGFQVDVTLADGAQFNGVQLADRAADLQVIYNRISANTYRIIAFSTGNAAIEGNEGELFTLDIAGNHNINITNIEFADAAANAYAIGFAETTGINGIYAGAANVESYTVGGVKNDKVRKGMNIVRTADGKVKKVFVK